MGMHKLFSINTQPKPLKGSDEEAEETAQVFYKELKPMIGTIKATKLLPKLFQMKQFLFNKWLNNGNKMLKDYSKTERKKIVAMFARHRPGGKNLDEICDLLKISDDELASLRETLIEG